MTEMKNSFAAWRTMAQNEPQRLVDRFLGKCKLLPAESRRAFIASNSDRDTLIQNIKAATAHEDAPLAGVPYMLQDLFDVDGLPTRCGAPFQAPFEVSLEDGALLYHKLTSLGAALLAKTVPSEFGIDLRGRNKSFGDCPHADGLRYICGGGAGTCAYAVSAGWAPIAFGLDSSAGIRIPAAFHGLFGFRMGNNAYAKEGVFPIVPSLESIGWVTAQPEDLQTSIEAFFPLPKIPDPAQVATPRGYLLEDPAISLHHELKTSLMNLVRHLDIDDRPAPNKTLCQAFKESSEAFATIESRELYSIHQYWIEESGPRYSEALLRRIEAGQICTPDKADRAASIQQHLRETMVEFFRNYDYLAIPISPTPTPVKSAWSGQLENDLLRLNAPGSLTFLPILVLPFECDDGRHSAIQLILNPQKIHQTGKILQQVQPFYKDAK
jgi:Asp-tRNA(Asn)/Glu-tRNA(Gln) amidotransferase A subunit family amidase